MSTEDVKASDLSVHAPPPSDHVDGFACLPRLAAERETVGAFLKGAVAVVREHFAGPIASAEISIGAQSLKTDAISESRDAAPWRDAVEPVLVIAKADELSSARLYRLRNTGDMAAVIACPFPSGNGISGGIAVAASAQGEADLPRLLAELKGLASLVSYLAGAFGVTEIGAGSPADAATEAVARSNDYAGLTELAFAITNSLRSRFDCQQVAMGTVARHTVRLVSISGLDTVKRRSPGTVRIRQAMEECLDRQQTTVYQLEAGWQETASIDAPYRLHRQWHEAAGGAAVLSIPLSIDGRPIAVVSFRRRADSPFGTAEIARIEQLLAPFAPAIIVVRRASRSLPTAALDAAKDRLAWLVGPNQIGRKLAYGALLAGLAWFCFGTMPYRIVTPARVVPDTTIHITTPHEGRLDEALVREGDRVTAGQVLCAFDTAADALALAEITAEIEAVRIEIEQLMTAGDVRGAAIADARLGVTVARRAIIESRIDGALVRAPRAGVVVRGDLHQRVGQILPQGHALFEIAGDDSWRIDLSIPETAIEHVRANADASFAWSARPEEPISTRIERISPTATPSGGKNAFMARATLGNDAPAWMRYGVEGHAQIEAGRKPVWWVVLHGAIDAARMELWL